MNLRNRLSSPSQAANILVIDDDEIVLQAISDLLEAAGHHVHALVSPIGATQVIATQAISLAVIDLNMPIMRGDRFIALVRSWDRIRDLPIVLISGESMETIRAAAEQLRDVTVLTKAQMNELLVPTIAQLLAGQAPIVAARPNGTAAMGARDEPIQGPARPFALAVRAALAAWRDFVAGRALPGKVALALSACRAEAQQLSLGNVAALLASASELIGGMRPTDTPVRELDGTMVELLTHISSGEPEKLRAYDRSLALTVHRSRLERARSA